jgi:hypothetical protein
LLIVARKSKISPFSFLYGTTPAFETFWMVNNLQKDVKMSFNHFKTISAKLLGMAVLGAFAGICSGAVFSSVAAQKKTSLLFKDRSYVKVQMPIEPPDLTQESVNIAMEAFAIRKPRNVKHPIFLPSLGDRGLTTGGALEGIKEVFVGPAAFSSWAVLGSTLGHEIEVHGTQSFLRILLTDKITDFAFSARSTLGLVLPGIGPTVRNQFDAEGTWKAERNAYLYEIKHASRFGLTDQEKQSIEDVMTFYYPSRQ